MLYRKYFTRIENKSNFNEEPYNSLISSEYSNIKARNLFKDCFSNHVDYDNYLVDSLHYNEYDKEKTNDSTRYIEHDSLSAYFINKIYNPPLILNYETKEETPFNNFINKLYEDSGVKCDDILEYKLGSNRLRFLIGNVGEGKSALVKKIISTANRDTNTYSNFKVISVYLNFESLYHNAGKPKPLQESLLIDLYDKIVEKTECEIDLSSIVNGINIKNNPELGIKKILKYLRENHVRLVVFCDNIDFYHYYSARYMYFDEYYMNQEENINSNLIWLFSMFSDAESLGNLGLNVLFSIRKYVYTDIVQKIKGTSTEIDTSEAFYLNLPNEGEVLSSRFKLFKIAVHIISDKHDEQAKQLRRIQDVLNIYFNLNNFDINNHDNLKNSDFISNSTINVSNKSPINQIYKIGQHGYRTLVLFFSSLNIAYLDVDLIERFFKKQVSSLRLIYFTNVYQRYSQEKNHFPNLFLNDCVVSPDIHYKEAHQRHMHTYWLKYLILKIIVKNEKITFQEILDIFCTIGNYDEHLVRHIVGSLNTANEFRCIEYISSVTANDIYSKKLIPSERGKYFFKHSSPNIENCFDIEYLQIVVEDKWLSIPNNIIEDFYDVGLNYSHLYKTDSSYINTSIEHFIKKSNSSILFLNLLKSSYEIEIKQNKSELHSFLYAEKLLPNLNKAIRHIVSSAEGLINSFGRSRELYKIRKLENTEDTFESIYNMNSFFNEYYNNVTELKKVQ
jgi:hypothetical protein